MTCKTRLLTVILLILLSYFLIPVNQTNAQSRFQHSDATAVMLYAGYTSMQENVKARSVGFSASVNRKVDLSIGISTVFVKNQDNYADWNFEILSFGATAYPSREWDGSNVTSQFTFAISKSYNRYREGFGAVAGFGISKQLDNVHPSAMFFYSPLAAGIPAEDFALGLDITFSIGLGNSASILIGPSLNIGLNYDSWVPGIALGFVIM